MPPNSLTLYNVTSASTSHHLQQFPNRKLRAWEESLRKNNFCLEETCSTVTSTADFDNSETGVLADDEFSSISDISLIADGLIAIRFNDKVKSELHMAWGKTITTEPLIKTELSLVWCPCMRNGILPELVAPIEVLVVWLPAVLGGIGSC